MAIQQDMGWQVTLQTAPGQSACIPAPPRIPPGITSREPPLQPPACPPHRFNPITADTHLLQGLRNTPFPAEGFAGTRKTCPDCGINGRVAHVITEMALGGELMGL